MRTILYNFLLLIIMICLNACTKDIDLPIPETTPKLVMNGLMEPDSIFILNLSSSVSAKSGNLPTYVNDATVQIYENGTLLKTLKYRKNLFLNPWSTPIEGNYLDSSFTIIPGHNYEVKAIKSGFADVTATINMPLPLICDTIAVKEVVLSIPGGFGGSQTNPGKSVQFKITDQDPSTKNYFLLRVRQFDSSFAGRINTGIGTNDLSLQDLNGLQGTTESADVLYLNDDLFSNGQFLGEIHFVVYDKSGWGSFAGDIYYLEVLAISKEYYLYLQSVDSYNNSNGNPFAEPAQIVSNVNNGYGMLACQVMKRFRLPK